MRLFLVFGLSLAACSIGCAATPAPETPGPQQAPPVEAEPMDVSGAPASAAPTEEPAGLGLSGTGPGGGGTSTGGIGLGTHGYGNGGSSGSGSGARGQVAGATATSSGSGLPPEVIKRVIAANVSAIRACYETAMMKAPTLAGKVAVSFTIGPQGKVVSASPGDTTIADAEMVSCVVTAMKGMTFPAPENGGTILVTYPFNFTPAGS